jgi:hypothetical protein
MNGDATGSGMIFSEDGTLHPMDEYGMEIKLEGLDEITYTVDGDMVTFYADDNQSTLLIVDEYTLKVIGEDDEDESVLLINAAGVIAQINEAIYSVYEPNLRPVLFDEYYCLEGDKNLKALCFRDDGIVDIETPDAYNWGTYTPVTYIADDATLTIYIDGGETVEFSIADTCTLTEIATGDRYWIVDSLPQSLAIQEKYYQNADEDGFWLYFWDDGEVDIELPGTLTMSAYYTVDEEEVRIKADGEYAWLEIINAYTLLSESGALFVRQP